MMKRSLNVFAVIMVAFVCTSAFAQEQVGKETYPEPIGKSGLYVSVLPSMTFLLGDAKDVLDDGMGFAGVIGYDWANTMVGQLEVTIGGSFVSFKDPFLNADGDTEREIAVDIFYVLAGPRVGASWDLGGMSLDGFGTAGVGIATFTMDIEYPDVWDYPALKKENKSSGFCSKLGAGANLWVLESFGVGLFGDFFYAVGGSPEILMPNNSYWFNAGLALSGKF